MALYLSESTGILFKTFPILLVRMGITILAFMAWVVYFGLIFLLGRGVSSIHANAEPITWFVGFLTAFPLGRLIQEYLLYLVKSAHVAVIVQLYRTGSLPANNESSLLAFGQNRVKELFKTSSALFLVDRIIHGLISQITGLMMGLTQFFSGVPGMDALRKLARTILFFSLTYVDEAILARKFLYPEENIWDSARRGIILYAQSWREILWTALLCGIIVMVSLPVFLVFTLGPAFAAAQLYPDLKWYLITLGVVGGWFLKSLLVDPFTMTLTIVTYLKTTEGKVPDPAWEQKLLGASKKFRELTAKSAAPVTP